MHPFFSVTNEEVQRLTDIQSRELIARLCRAELRKNGISQDTVTWGGDQRAKDGGVDVRIEINPVSEISGYIPSCNTVFQVKAEKFPPSRIANEIAPKGELRPAIKDWAGHTTGAYILVSTRDSLSDSSLRSRKKAMEDCLTDHGFNGQVHLDFYDSRKIADWIEQHPAIAVWVKHVTGHPLVGWKPYGPWAYREDDIQASYILDDRVKVVAPNSNESIDINQAINSLRKDLEKNVSVRIVGLSGVGKTRLVQALFDDRIETAYPSLVCENILYTDLSHDPTPQPIAMIDALLSDSSDAIVVIDNCGPDVHQRLTELVKCSGSRLRLISIEYDIRDDLPEDTVCYRLEGSSNEVIGELLKRRYPALTHNDVDKITEFSDGNARVAYALADSSQSRGELSKLEDAELFRRLFIQKNSENDELLRCAQIASLLYSFDAEDMNVNSELSILASLAEVTVQTLSRNISELQKRGLVQQRGKWKAVLPHAISNRLAVQALEFYPKDLFVDKLVNNAPDRVAQSFSRRLGFLHESQCVRTIVEEWLKPGGRYSDLSRLDEIGRKIYGNIAPVDQKAALNALLRATESKEFVAVESRHRGDFARIARSLAYEAELFDDAVLVLSRFALSETEGYKNNSTHDILKSLFYSCLSGTEARTDQRAAFVRRYLSSNNETEQRLGLFLLGAALEASHFSSFYGFDFGARKRGHGWRPRTLDDVHKWYVPFIDIAVEMGKSENEFGREVRALLGREFRGLWLNAGLTEQLKQAAEALSNIDGWPEGWHGIRRTLHYHKEKLQPDSLAALRELEAKLAPKGLAATIRAKILAGDSSLLYLDDEDEEELESAGSKFNKSLMEAKRLGVDAAANEQLVLELLPDLLKSGVNGTAGNFGFGVGQSFSDPAHLLGKARDIVKQSEEAAISLIFVRGIVSGWNDTNASATSQFLDQAVSDSVWGKWFPELQVQINLEDAGYARLTKALDLGIAPIWQYRNLSWGHTPDTLSLEQIAVIVTAIASKTDGLPVAIDLLGMVHYSAAQKDKAYRNSLAKFCVAFLQKIDWSKINIDDGSLGHHLDILLDFAIASTKSANKVSSMLSNLIQHERSKRRIYAFRQGRLLKAFFKYQPLMTLDAIYQPDKDGFYNTTTRLAGNRADNHQAPPIRAASDESILEWCDRSPSDRYLFAAEVCGPFDKFESQESEGGKVVSLSELAKQIFSRSTDKRAVLKIYLDDFVPTSWSGSRAEIIRRRLPLIDELNPEKNNFLSEVIAQEKTEFEKIIASEEEQEAKRERERTNRFE